MTDRNDLKAITQLVLRLLQFKQAFPQSQSSVEIDALLRTVAAHVKKEERSKKISQGSIIEKIMDRVNKKIALQSKSGIYAGFGEIKQEVPEWQSDNYGGFQIRIDSLNSEDFWVSREDTINLIAKRIQELEEMIKRLTPSNLSFKMANSCLSLKEKRLTYWCPLIYFSTCFAILFPCATMGWRELVFFSFVFLCIFIPSFVLCSLGAVYHLRTNKLKELEKACSSELYTKNDWIRETSELLKEIEKVCPLLFSECKRRLYKQGENERPWFKVAPGNWLSTPPNLSEVSLLFKVKLLKIYYEILQNFLQGRRRINWIEQRMDRSLRESRIDVYEVFHPVRGVGQGFCPRLFLLPGFEHAKATVQQEEDSSLLDLKDFALGYNTFS